MSRGVILLAVALTLALSPVAAAGQTGAQPDLIFVGRRGNTFTGDDVYDVTGVGQQRSVIVDRRRTLTLRLQNDGDEPSDFDVIATGANHPDEFTVTVTARRAAGSSTVQGPDGAGISTEVDAGAHVELRVVIEVVGDAPLGATLDLLVKVAATSSFDGDAVRIKVTKTSTPP